MGAAAPAHEVVPSCVAAHNFPVVHPPEGRPCRDPGSVSYNAAVESTPEHP